MKTLIFLMMCVLIAHGRKKVERCRPVPNVKVPEGPRFQLQGDVYDLREKVAAFKSELNDNEAAENCLIEILSSSNEVDKLNELEAHVDELYENFENLSEEEIKAELEIYVNLYSYLNGIFFNCVGSTRDPRETLKFDLTGLQNKLLDTPRYHQELIDANPGIEECMAPIIESVDSAKSIVDEALKNFDELTNEELQAAFDEAFNIYAWMHEEIPKCLQDPRETLKKEFLILQAKLQDLLAHLNELKESNPEAGECLIPVIASVKPPTLQVDAALEQFDELSVEELQAKFEEAYNAYVAIHEELAACNVSDGNAERE